MVPESKQKGMAGGLGVAICDALENRGGIWFGWSGDLVSEDSYNIKISRNKKTTYAMIDIPEKDFHGFYNGYSNSIIWPLFHYRSDLLEYHRSYYDDYMRVNQSIAERVASHINKEDLVILISSSGQSKNVINAAKFCKRNKIKLVTFTGFNKNNKLKKLGVLNFWVNSKKYNFVENIHQTWLLSIVDKIK